MKQFTMSMFATELDLFKAKSEYLEQQNDKLMAEVAMLRECCIEADAVFQSSRVWGGMEYVMHPIHPLKYKKVAADIRAALDLLHTTSADEWLAGKIKEAKQWIPMSDVQWMNIVNHEHAWDGYDKEDAVHLAVKMTEAKCLENNQKN